MSLHTQLFSTASSESTPPVVLLHGFASSAEQDFLATGWAEAFTTAGRSVIAIDLPGHGAQNAPLPAEEASTSAVVRAILGAIEAQTPEGEFDVVSYSLGSRLAWELPEASPRVRRMVLGGLSPFEPFTAVDPAELQSTLAGQNPANPLVGMMAGMISAPGQDTASLATLISGLASEPFSPSGGTGPQVPTLFVAGTGDDMTQGIESLTEGLPRACLTRVPGDHRGALDSPEFRSAAIEFLAG